MENPWKSLSQRKIYNNPWISLTEHEVINPNGGKGIYGVVHFENLAIGILAIEKDGAVWLVGQYRFPINGYSWEIPEGGGPHNDDPLASAIRELKEETGFKAKYWKEIQRMHLSNSVSDEVGIIYLAYDLEEGEAEPEETEKLMIRKVPFPEALEMVKKGEITDSISVAAILKLKLLMDEVGGQIQKIFNS